MGLLNSRIDYQSLQKERAYLYPLPREVRPGLEPVLTGSTLYKTGPAFVVTGARIVAMGKYVYKLQCPGDTMTMNNN